MNKCNDITQNKAKAVNTGRFKSADGCKNDSNIPNIPVQALPNPPTDINDSVNAGKVSGKIHKCPHCSQTFNLKRHIARVHKDVEKKQNETTSPAGRCTCFDCEFKSHKITDLRNHLQKAHGMKFNTTTTNFNTNTGM